MMIEKFIRGKYNLAVTFWAFGAFAAVAYHVISIVIFNNLFKFSGAVSERDDDIMGCRTIILCGKFFFI